MKRLVIGFVIGVGLMYYYLHYGEFVRAQGSGWFQGSASNYRGDTSHEAARDALGESERRR
jgi:hypothetical protein